MKLSVLISCMYETDDIIQRTNIQTDVIVVNQCDVDCIKEITFENKAGDVCKGIFINTTERGLSKSRNLALQTATSDICLLCDDDEILIDGYEKIILKAFSSQYNPDIGAFIIKPRVSIKTAKTIKLSWVKALKISSVQIAFKRLSVIENKISFDEKLGSGTGNGAGEENKFLLDNLKAGASLYYFPQVIGNILNNSVSRWFFGYNNKYFIDQGWSNRRIFGTTLGFLYNWYYIFFKHYIYKDQITLWRALKNIHIGFFEKR